MSTTSQQDEISEQDYILGKKKKKKQQSQIEKPDELYSYVDLLERFYSQLSESQETITDSTSIKVTLPVIAVSRVGSKKTAWTNMSEICRVIHRQTDHIKSFFATELATETSIDGNNNLIIKGRYTHKQFESIIKQYICIYVSCSVCKSLDTELNRDPVTRLFFVKCSVCGSQRSVPTIKQGFQAITRSDRKKET